MKINADFKKRVLVDCEKLDWINSPMPGVTRRPLDRVGEEIARATSLVRYAPGSQFSRHVHTGGEEFLVLEGVFQDEHGDFPAGSYIRNPPQSSHTPGSQEGCIIFVKLWQFTPDDRINVRLNVNFMQPVPHKDKDGVSITPLFIDQYETVSIHDWDADTPVTLNPTGGLEAFVLSGDFVQNGDRLTKHCWLRLPVGSDFKAKAGPAGARVWIKQNHLLNVEEQIKRVVNR